jgi:hypothetical protein
MWLIIVVGAPDTKDQPASNLDYQHKREDDSCEEERTNSAG